MAKKTEYSDMKEGEKVETVFSNETSFNGVLKFDTSLKISSLEKMQRSRQILKQLQL